MLESVATLFNYIHNATTVHQLLQRISFFFLKKHQAELNFPLPIHVCLKTTITWAIIFIHDHNDDHNDADIDV